MDGDESGKISGRMNRMVGALKGYRMQQDVCTGMVERLGGESLI
jgi:hypothetical protein